VVVAVAVPVGVGVGVGGAGAGARRVAGLGALPARRSGGALGALQLGPAGANTCSLSFHYEIQRSSLTHRTIPPASPAAGPADPGPVAAAPRSG